MSAVLVQVQELVATYLAPMLSVSAPASGQCRSIVSLPFSASAAPESIMEEFANEIAFPCVAIGFPDETYEAGGVDSGVNYCRVNSVARFALIYFTDVAGSPASRFAEHATFRDRIINALPARSILESEYPTGCKLNRFALVSREYTAGPDWAATRVQFEVGIFQIAGALTV